MITALKFIMEPEIMPLPKPASAPIFMISDSTASRFRAPGMVKTRPRYMAAL
eukprot:COSAG01_NODE_24125_length_789_cov_2.023188_2_plen_51_part_01